MITLSVEHSTLDCGWEAMVRAEGRLVHSDGEVVETAGFDEGDRPFETFLDRKTYRMGPEERDHEYWSLDRERRKDWRCPDRTPYPDTPRALKCTDSGGRKLYESWESTLTEAIAKLQSFVEDDLEAILDFDVAPFTIKELLKASPPIPLDERRQRQVPLPGFASKVLYPWTEEEFGRIRRSSPGFG